MPVPVSKKQHTYGASSTSARNKASSRSFFPLTSLPREVLARVVLFVGEVEEDEADEDENLPTSSLASLCLVSNLFLSLAQPLLLLSLELEGGEEVVSAAKVFKPKNGKGYKVEEQGDDGGMMSALRHARELSVSVKNPYSTSPTRSTLLSSLYSLINLSPSLTSLTLSIGDPSASTARHGLRSLFPSFPSPLTSLTNLETFRLLPSAEIWLHDLALLLSSWPSLQKLDLFLLGGDCNHSLDPWSSRPDNLVKLVLKESTLTGEMMSWLLDGQKGLKWIEMPLPGCEEGNRAWKAVEKVVEGVEVLKVWDGWAGKGGTGRGGKKSTAIVSKKADGGEEAAAKDDSSDIFEYPPSPLLPLLTKCTSLRTLLLTTSLLPSAPSAESFSLLLPHLTDLEVLLIEDTPASGLRAAVQEALEGREGLQWLEEVVSVRVKRRKGGKKGEEGEGKGGPKMGKAEKAFKKVCEKRGVEWEVEYV